MPMKGCCNQSFSSREPMMLKDPTSATRGNAGSPEVLPNDVMIVAVFALIASALLLLAANEIRDTGLSRPDRLCTRFIDKAYPHLKARPSGQPDQLPARQIAKFIQDHEVEAGEEIGHPPLAAWRRGRTRKWLHNVDERWRLS